MVTRVTVCIILFYFSPILGWLPVSGYVEHSDSIDHVFRSFIERLIDEYDPDVNDQMMEILETLRDHPININSATESDLYLLPFLSGDEIRSILQTRRRVGEFKSPDDLFSVPDLPRETVLLLLNFVVIEREVQKVPIISSLSVRSYVSRELQVRRGYLDGMYLGSPTSTFHRIVFESPKGIRGGFLMSKRAGEPSLTEQVSGYVALPSINDRIDLILGNFRVEVGQGLMLGSGFGISKGGNPTGGIVKRSSGIQPLVSRSDHYRFQGAAATIRLLRTEGLLFISSTPRTATVYENGTVRTLTSFPVYRTETDRSKRNAVNELMYGMHIRQRLRDRFFIGWSWYSLRYNREFLPDNPVRFSGRQNHHMGLDWFLEYRNVSLAGEAASSTSARSIAFISTLGLTIAENFETSLLFRSYPPAYVSKYGFSFNERGSNPEDERGVYAGLRYRPAPRFLIEAYIDAFTFSNASRSPPLHTTGSDMFFRVTYPVADGSQLEARVRRRTRGEIRIVQNEEMSNRIVVDRSQTNVRLDLTTQPIRAIRLRLRTEGVYLSYPELKVTERGMYLLTDVRWILTPRLSVEGRILFYDTDSFDSALYTLEYDMPGRMRMILLNGQGAITSLSLRLKLSGNLNLNLKYTENYRSDGQPISGGLQQVDGPSLGMVMFQVDFRL